MSKHCVAILTYDRPADLERCLLGIALQNFDVAALQVLVIDNHPSGSGETVCRSFKSRLPCIQYLHYGAENIAQGRNLALQRCDRPYLIFIDDDEVADRNWLLQLEAARARYNVQGVVGSVIYDYLRPQSFVAKSRFLDLSNPPTGSFSGFSYHTGNCLIDMAFVRAQRLRFSAAFGKTGSSDTYFYLRMNEAGGRTVWTRDAYVHYRVPASRCTLVFGLKRAVRTAGNYARMVTLIRVPERYEVTRTFMKRARFAARDILLSRSRLTLRLNVATGMRMVACAVGAFLYEAFGLVYQEYEKRPGFTRVTRQYRLGSA